MFLLILITTLISSGSYGLDEGIFLDYYWREYFGIVPGDAIVAGENARAEKVYVGQAYIKDVGLVVGQINAGVREMTLPYGGGTRKAQKYIKILCGLEDNFTWMKANHTHLHLQVTGKHAVLGGHQDDYGYLNVGRIEQKGETIVGKVASFWTGNAWFYHPQNGTEKMESSYEILLYNSPSVNIDIRL